LTRATAALARGDWSEAWRMHPLAVPVGLEVGVAWLAWGLALRRGRFALPRSGSAAYRGALAFAAVVTAVLLLVVWIARLARGTLPP
jgi:hypothetical protein